MTAETDLLPIPNPVGSWDSEWQEYGYTSTQMQAYARANLAELQREVEGLRAEVAEWKAVAKWEGEQHDSAFHEARTLNARAERLAGALRGLLNDTQHKDHNCGDAEWCPVIAARAALDQETTNG